VTQSGAGRAAAALGLTLYQLRLARGLSLRMLARRLGMSGHGSLLEYERGRRIPPEDVVLGYERVLEVTDGRLQRLRDQALLERAAAKAAQRQDGAATEEPAASAPLVAPAQLPPDVADFTGRDTEIAELCGQDAPSISVISGNPGIGKTTLAVHVARLLAADYPDAQLYCDLHGVHDPADPADVLATLIRVLGVPDSQLPSGLEERASLCRSLLHGRRALLVLDNAADEAQVRPLLPGGPHCRTLITSRSRLSGLAGVHRIALGLPPLDNAVALLTSITGQQRAAAEPAAVEQLVRACGLLPLAVRIAGNRLAGWPQWTVEYLVGRLADEQNRLAWLKAGDLEVRSAFAVSYEALSPTCRQVFGRLSLVPGGDFGAELAAVVADRAVADAEQALDDLAAASLVEPAPTAGRYRLHDLLRIYAGERLRDEVDEPQRSAARQRMVDWLLGTALEAAKAIDPTEEGGGRLGGDRASALAWLDAEHHNVLGAARLADGRQVVDLLEYLVWYLDLRCAWADLRQLSELAMSGAPDLSTAALAWNCLGLAFGGTNEYQQAANCHERAAELARSAGDLAYQASAYDKLGVALWGLERFAEAADNHRRAIEICRSIGHQWGEFAGLNHLGYALYWMDRFGEASDCHAAARRIMRELGDLRGEAMATQALGRALTGLGRYTEARECFDQALAVFTVAGDQYAIALARQGMGLVLHGLGEEPAAVDQLRHALALFEAVRDRLWEAHTLRALGTALLAAGQPVEARVYWQRAVRNYEKLGSAAAVEVRRLLLGESSNRTEPTSLP
jgi:tetratricopeptide (TPR) repeat protein/transcriptional regulator with XRE-family HTH domain